MNPISFFTLYEVPRLMHSAHSILASPRQYVFMVPLSTSTSLLLSNDTPIIPLGRR